MFQYGAMNYLVMKNADLNSLVKADIPDAEAFVIYTGRKKIDRDVIFLNQEFVGWNPDKPEFKARIIHGEIVRDSRNRKPSG